MLKLHNSTMLFPYLAQAPCVMSTLEVLQSCPTQRKNLLTTLEALDLNNTNLIHFNIENYESRIPHKLAFQIIMKIIGKKFFRMVLYEGASTLVLSLSCWKCLGSPELVTSPTTLKAFDRWGFHPHGLISSLEVQLGGKTISIEVEVVDSPLDYNLSSTLNADKLLSTHRAYEIHCQPKEVFCFKG